MPKLSINEAVKQFQVSRPTIFKHLKQGRLSGNKGDKGWQLDGSELSRVYAPRKARTDKKLTDNLPTVVSSLEDTLKQENEQLKAELAVASALADERGKRLDQLVPMLADQRKPKRGWWPWR